MVAWPAILKPSAFGYYRINYATSGGVSPTGVETFVSSAAGRWGARMTLSIRRREHVWAIRELRQLANGPVNAISLPNFDALRLNYPREVDGAGNLTGRILTPRLTRDTVLDGTLYEDASIPTASEVEPQLNAAVAVGATSAAFVTQDNSGPLRAGMQFGLGQRLYEIRSIVSVVSNLTSITFWPRARTAALTGASVFMTRPVCLMRCLNLDDELQELDGFRRTVLNLVFSEFL